MEFLASFVKCLFHVLVSRSHFTISSILPDFAVSYRDIPRSGRTDSAFLLESGFSHIQQLLPRSQNISRIC
jgi:hypothetical protein